MVLFRDYRGVSVVLAWKFPLLRGGRVLSQHCCSDCLFLKVHTCEIILTAQM